MDDNELDRLFEQAANKYVPPPPPEGAWDNFVETKLTSVEKPQKTRIQSFKKWLAALLIPKTTWQLITYGLVAIIGIWLFIGQMSQPALKDSDKKVAIQKNGQRTIPGNTPIHQQPPLQAQTQVHDSAAVVAIGANSSKNGSSVDKSALATPVALNPLIAAGSKIAQAEKGKPTTGPANGIQNMIAKGPYPNQMIQDSLLFNQGVARLMNKGIIQKQPKSERLSKSLFVTPGFNQFKNNIVKALPLDSARTGLHDYLAKTNKQSSQVVINGKIDNTPFNSPLKTNVGSQTITELSFNQTDNRRTRTPQNEDHKDDTWQLGLLAGTNISTVKGTVSKNLGLNGGVMVQHRINSSRLSVETGLVVASMDYKVANEDFHPGGKEVSDKVSNVNGTCTMLDVPVNVRYDLVRSKKSNAFISTGVSAMVMVNQDYNYYYTGQNKVTEVTKDVSGQGNDVYASTNISVGYERRFKKTAIQVAPYVKVPMGAVGYGNLSLGNIGAQISIKKDL